jgi:hypothetical protein
MAPKVARSVGPPRRASASPAGAGVPLSVQTAIPGPLACPHSREHQALCPAGSGPVLAYRVIAAFSRPGDLVATAGIGARTLAAAAAAAGRTAIIVSPGAQPHRRARLAVTAACHCPAIRLPGHGPDDPGLDDAIGACAQTLRPGGLLAVRTSAGRAPGQAGRVVARARAAGLRYTQHIVLVHAVISGNSLDGPRLPPHPHGPPVHAAAHTDLLLFTAPEGPADD